MIQFIVKIKSGLGIFFLFLIVFLFEYLSAQTPTKNGWFWQYPKPQGNTLNDIYIFNRDTAIAVGDLGSVIKTTDGGGNWSVEHHTAGTLQDLKGVYFIDQLRGWAVGGNTLIKTEDGGSSWTEIQTNTPLAMRAVHFVDIDTGIVIGDEGIILRTTDSGNSWDIRKIDNYIGNGWLDVFNLDAITFTDKQTGWIIGAGYYGNQIYKTTDCGRSWQWNEFIIQPKVYSGLSDICFINKNCGVITGDLGAFLKTTDGGTTWQYQNLSEKYQKWEYQYFYSTFFTDSLTGWIVGGSNNAFILKTTDGGENWIEAANNDSEMMHRFYKIRFSDTLADNSGWIIGQFGMIYRTIDTGDTWTSQREKRYNFNSVYFTDLNTGWVVGDSGVILSTIDGGENWIKQFNSDSIILSSVYAIDSQNVFAVGSILKGYLPSYMGNGVILKTNNGGQLWIKQSFDTLQAFGSIVFVDDSTGWIMVTSGTLLKTIDKGNTWEPFSTVSGTLFYEMQFINRDIGWISDIDSDHLLKTTDGGKNWSPQFIDSTFNIYSFNFINTNTGWAVGTQNGYNNVFKTTDGGMEWLPYNNVPISNYYSVKFINDNIGWIAGDRGPSGSYRSVIVKTTNGGFSWIDQEGPSTGGLMDLFFVNEDIGWSVGDGIFKTINGGGIVSVEKLREEYIPRQIELLQNYPNPFNSSTTIEFVIEEYGNASLRVYDILGREVSELLNKKISSGKYKVKWNAEKLSSGVYFYKLRVGEYSKTKKMLLLK